MKRGNIRKICAAVWGILLLLGACSQQNPVVNFQDTRESTTITFFGNKYEPENVTVIEEIISGFMTENPNIRVSYESLKGADYFDALSKRMAAGKGDDVFMTNHDTTLDLTGKGQLADLTSLATISNYTEQMRSQMQSEQGIFWVPTTVSVFGLYCNLDLLTMHGHQVPDTLPEWQQICDDFVQKGITPIIANNDISLKTLAIGRSFFDIYQENRQKEVFDQLTLGKANLSDYLTPGFTLAETLITSGYLDADKALETKKTSDDLQEFVQGNAPFMLTGAWAAGRVTGMKPAFSFEVAPLPLLDDGALLVMNPDTRLSVNADSEHLDEAIKFVEYFTRAENIQKFADQQSSFSPLLGGAPSGNQEIQPLLPCYQAGRTVIGSDGLLDLPIWNLTAEVSQQLLSGEPLAAAMNWLDGQITVEEKTP